MDFLWNVFSSWWDMTTDWAFGTFVGVVLALVAIIIFGFILYGCYKAVDYCFLATKEGTGTVVKKRFSPAHTVIGLNLLGTMVSNLPIPEEQYVASERHLAIEIDNKRAWTSVDELDFENACRGGLYRVKYSIGRISHKLYIKDIDCHDVRAVKL